MSDASSPRRRRLTLLLIGAMSAFDISGTYSHRALRRALLSEQDTRSPWQTVGDDLRAVMARHPADSGNLGELLDA